MYGGNSLQRQLRTTSLVIPGDAPPKENRIHKRQKIIDELDMIKFRVDQVNIDTDEIHICIYSKNLRKCLYF